MAAGPTPEPVVRYDMAALSDWDLKDPATLRRYYDETMLVTCLQGIANRETPRLFVRYNTEPDDFWWKLISEDPAWLDGREVIEMQDLAALLEYFEDDYDGLVLWDERVPATSNVAATIAGVENLLAARADSAPASLCAELTTGDKGLAVKRTLMHDDGGPLFTGTGTIPGTSVPSTGSAKNDAHHWLIEHYIKKGKTNPTKLGYYLDGFWLKCWQAGGRQNHTVNNLDYVIANRGVIFDLNVWEDEVPVDDPDQQPGTDLKTLNALLRACYDQTDGQQMLHAAGFIPWAYKYTDHKNSEWDAGGKYGGVPTEWKYAEILSCYNAYMDADALGYSSFPNGSFYQHYPLPDVIPQNPKPTRESLTEQGLLDSEGKIVPANYYAHYQGDYDAAAWLYWKMPEFWTDPARGEAPMTWPFNPGLAQRFAFGMHWLRETRTPNDFFIAGDVGVGYLNPYHLSEPREYSGLPSGWAAWEALCQKFFRQWDITATGFIIDGNTPGMTEEGWDAYARFSPDGFIPQKSSRPRGVHNGAPYLRMFGDLPRDTGQDALEAARIIHSNFVEGAPNFIFYRSILKPPSYYVQIDEELKKMGGAPSRLVDIYTLMWLVREYETNREQYVSDSVYGSATRVEATPDEHAGIHPIRVADGRYEVQEANGEMCWLVPGGQGGAHLYFGVNDDFCYELTGPVILEITFLDTGTEEIGLHYDSTDQEAPLEGAYKTDPDLIQRTGTGEWRTERIVLPDANFQNRQNGMADFRFRNTGDSLYVRKISVERTR
jgi:hypothetical protein